MAPAVLVVLVATVTFGDPRYHTMADLGVVVLTAVAACEVVRRRQRRTDASGEVVKSATAGNGSGG